ncbi:hypothetical protein ACFPK1_08520 [Actinomycetospora rhizophila]|uniref:Uncharacterized protein n=1 Tax=Actinomycetospora rhizophila TaxID=1416876 RepID=A0ABV9ZCJ8_9PSEU
MVLERPAVTGLPRLDVGKHTDPEQGACLMEYVSVLAGLRFTDRPACTPGAVAVVARRVNDAVSDRARTRLAPSAPDLIDIRPRQGGLDDVVVLCCTTTGLAVAPGDRRLTALRQRARRRLGHPWLRWLRLPAHAVVHEAVIAVVDALAPLPTDDRDERLIGLLAEVVRAVRGATAAPRSERRTDDVPPGSAPVATPGAVASARGTGRR